MRSKSLLLYMILGVPSAPIVAQDTSGFEPKVTELVYETRITPDRSFGLSLSPQVAAGIQAGQIEIRARAVYNPDFDANLIHVVQFIVPGGTPLPAPAVPDESSPMLVLKYAVRVTHISFSRKTNPPGTAVAMLGHVVWRPARFQDPPIDFRTYFGFAVLDGQTQPFSALVTFPGVLTVVPRDSDSTGSVKIAFPNHNVTAAR